MIMVVFQYISLLYYTVYVWHPIHSDALLSVYISFYPYNASQRGTGKVTFSKNQFNDINITLTDNNTPVSLDFIKSGNVKRNCCLFELRLCHGRCNRVFKYTSMTSRAPLTRQTY